MSLLPGIALAAASLLLAAVLAYALATAWRAMNDDAPLPLFDIIERSGITPQRLDAVASVRTLALAARRCTFCGGKEQCRAWLAAGEPDGAPAFCANAGLFEQWHGR